jgi:hypothetical protein
LQVSTRCFCVQARVKVRVFLYSLPYFSPSSCFLCAVRVFVGHIGERRQREVHEGLQQGCQGPRQVLQARHQIEGLPQEASRDLGPCSTLKIISLSYGCL